MVVVKPYILDDTSALEYKRLDLMSDPGPVDAGLPHHDRGPRGVELP